MCSPTHNILRTPLRPCNISPVYVQWAEDEIGHGQNMFHLTRVRKICPLKKQNEVDLRTQPLPQTPYNVYSIGLWERAKKGKSEFYFCSGQNVF